MEREWKKGFPKHTGGLNGNYLFEILIPKTLLDSEKIVEAYMKDEKWHLNENRLEITALVTAWWETYDCKTAHEAINQYLRHRGIVVRENLSDAFHRHIRMDSDEFINCEECWQYFLLKTGQEYSIPSPKEWLKIKESALCL